MRNFAAIAVVLVLGASVLGQEKPQTPSFTLNVSGEKTWTLRLGLGSPGLLSGEKLPPDQLVLHQTLRAEIEGKALDFLTLQASFNDQLGPGFQEFVVLVDKAPWKGELGRFVVGTEGDVLGVYNKRVLGARGEYAGDGFAVRGLLARLEGVSESRVFRGERGLAEVTFTFEDPEQPWRPAPYPLALEGLAHWTLARTFVEGLSKVALAFKDSAELWSFLTDWGLGYLEETLRASLVVELREGQYLVIESEPQALALRAAPRVLLRQQLQDRIDEYNRKEGLTGKDRKSYPFSEESDLDVQFLSKLAQFAGIKVDEDFYPLSEPLFRRFLALGERDVLEGSLELAFKLPGQADSVPSTDPAVADFRWRLHSGPGILEINFPETFFRPGAALSVKFAYKREGISFGLGLSVVPGSERVYLNGKLLAREVDYTIDYEAGLLLLFPSLSPEDVLQVDFERQRGALGVPTEYERYFLGLELTVAGWDGLRLGVYRAMDLGQPGPTSRTMPNTHTIATLSLLGQVAGWDYRLSLGGSENVFPSDDNARVPLPNRINDVAGVRAADGEYVVFAHQNGLTVYKDGTFAGYGAAQGLSGRAARTILPLPDLLLVGTEAGLTLIQLDGSKPFDRVRNWFRLYPEDWNKERPLENRIRGKSILALALGQGQLWLATEEEVVSLGLGQVQSPKDWRRIPLPEGGVRSTDLWAGDGGLYLGTDQGLWFFAGESWRAIPEVNTKVWALTGRGKDVLVATDQGIHVLRDQAQVGWVDSGRPVYALALREDLLWWATDDGLRREGKGDPVVRGKVTAVGAAGETVWAGGEADENFQVRLWRVGARVETFEPRHTKIDGRDTGSFRDIPAAEHSRVGLSGSLTLARTFGDWKWQISAFSRLPGYEEIGRAGRSDSHGLGISGSLASGALALDLRLRWDVRDLTSRASSKVVGGLEARWTGSPTFSVSLTPSLSGDGLWNWSKLESAWRVGLSDSTQTFSWSLSGAGNLTYPAFFLGGDGRASVRWRPVPDWTFEGSWSRPFRTRGAPGDEVFVLSASWSSSAQKVTWTASWQETLRHTLAADRWTGERLVQAALRLPTWQAQRVEIAPRLNVAWRSGSGEDRLNGTLSATLVQGPATLSLSLTGGQSYRPASERLERTFGLSVGWDHSGWGGVRPSLRWDRTATLLTHPRYPDQLTETDEVVLRLAIEPARQPWRDSVTLTWRPREARLSLANQLQWRLPSGSLASRASATLKGSTLEGKIDVEVGVPIDAILRVFGARPVGDNWAFNAELGYLVGAKPGQAPAHALTLGATLIARF